MKKCKTINVLIFVIKNEHNKVDSSYWSTASLKVLAVPSKNNNIRSIQVNLIFCKDKTYKTFKY